MQRAKKHAGHNSPAKRRKVAVSSPKTVPTRKPPTPIKEEEDDYDDDSAPAQPAPKQAKARSHATELACPALLSSPWDRAESHAATTRGSTPHCWPWVTPPPPAVPMHRGARLWPRYW